MIPATSTPYRFEVQYNYDSASGALTSVENAQTGFVYWQVASGGAAPVDAFGHLLGWTDGNNVSTVMAYDAATGAPLGISSGIGQSSAVQSLTYTWDGYGNLSVRQDTNQTLTETFGYDALNRLTGSTVTNPAANGPTLGFVYDAVGNITSKTVSGTTESYSYDPNHPYAVDSVTNVNGGTYTASYDADGNMITRNGSAIAWTPANLPASLAGTLGSSTFNYDPDHNRYYQTASLNGVSTDTTYIAGGLFEVVATNSGTTEYRHSILADGQVIAVHTITQGGNASTAYLHYDHLGSVDTITSDSGQVIQSMSFDAFGQRRLPSSWDYGVSQATLATLKNYTDRGYTDQEQLDNLSLVDLNGRVYDPTVGRFISADPTGGSGTGRYTYVGDNPLEFTDPTGFACKDGSANGINGPCGSVQPTIPLLPIGVNAPYFPIGDNPGEPGTTNLGNCGCVENTPGGNPSNGPSPGGNPNTSPAPPAGTPIAPVPVTSLPCSQQSWCAQELLRNYLNQLAIENIFHELSTTSRSLTPYMPINSAESQDVLMGNVSDFWTLRLAGKDPDPYAQIGCAFWCDASVKASLGAYWQTLAYMGIKSLNAGLLYAGDEPNAETVDQIGRDIMTNYVNFINGNNGDLPTIVEFDLDVHQPAFNQYGIPMSFFGGTLLFGQPWEMRLTAPIWCPECSRYPSLYGGGG